MRLDLGGVLVSKPRFLRLPAARVVIARQKQGLPIQGMARHHVLERADSRFVLARSERRPRLELLQARLIFLRQTSFEDLPDLGHQGARLGPGTAPSEYLRRAQSPFRGLAGVRLDGLQVNWKGQILRVLHEIKISEQGEIGHRGPGKTADGLEIDDGLLGLVQLDEDIGLQRPERLALRVFLDQFVQ